MQHQTAQDGCRHEARRARDVEPGARGKHRPQPVEGAEHHAARNRARHAKRRNFVKPADAEELGRGQGRRGRAGKRHGNQRERHQERADAEQREGAWLPQFEQKLRGAEPEIDHGHIDCEQPAPGFVAGAVVEPAFDADIEPGDAEALDQAQARPEIGIEREAVGQHGRRADRGAGGEDADMADPGDGAVDGERAGHEADEIGRADDTRNVGRIAFLDEAHAEQGADQAAGEDQQKGAAQQRRARCDELLHDGSVVSAAFSWARQLWASMKTRVIWG